MGEATSVAGYVQLSVDCGQIMQIAREQFYENHNITSAMKMLMDLTNCDELTKEEQKSLCLDILMYKKDIVGVYPREEIKIIECTEKPFDFFNALDKLTQKFKTQEKEYNSILQKFLFLCEKTDDRLLKRLNDSYYFETGEYLFDKDFGKEPEFMKWALFIGSVTIGILGIVCLFKSGFWLNAELTKYLYFLQRGM